MGICLGLTACGSGSDAPTYPDDPPERATPVLGDVTIPATVPLGTLRPAAVREKAKATGGLTPISTADPGAVLGGRTVANNFKPGNKNFTLVAGMEGRPLPTGKWYKGFFYQSPRSIPAVNNFDEGGDAIEQSVFAFPNRLWLDDRIGMVSVSFPRRRILDAGDINAVNNFGNPYRTDAYPFTVRADQRADAFITYAETAAGRLARRIDHEDELTVSTSWNSPAGAAGGAQQMKLISAVGSPYVTVKYTNLQPRIGMGESIRSQLGKNALNEADSKVRYTDKWEAVTLIKAVSVDAKAPEAFLETGNTRNTPKLTGKKFRFVYAGPDDAFAPDYVQRVMVVYASSEISLAWDPATRTYLADKPFNGVIRVAFVDDQVEKSAPPATVVAYPEREAVLDKHANEYPVSSGLNLQYAGTASGTVRYSWPTETMDGSKADGSKLLMMAFDATHLKSMPDANRTALTYRSNFGNMTGVVGGSWTQTLAIPAILGESPNKELLWHGNGTIKPADRPQIMASLRKDADVMKDYIAHCNYESYLCGKYVANIARMVLIADQMENEEGARALRAELIDFLKQNLNPWFDGKDDGDPKYADRIAAGIRDYFQYDTVNGGVVTLRPFTKNDIKEDFYNAIYTDHMFHYGYFIYAAAVVARYDAGWLASYKEPVNTLVRDIANASLSDTYFPITRTYDWFRMQNVADAGPDPNGANTESSSEAINSGYALVLWGAATGNGELQALSSIMVAGEIRTAQAFYQVTPSNNVFTEVAPKTVPIVGGSVSALTLDPATMITWGIKRLNLSESQVFFGQRRVYRVGIQILPFTPISEYVISPDWARTHQAALLQLEQDETALYEELFTADPTTLRCSLTDKGTRSLMPAADCAGAARVLYSWRQLMTSVNGMNDPNGAYARYVGYMAKVDQQTADFAKNSIGTSFDYIDANTKKQVTGTYAAPGVNADILKDVSTPSNNSNVLWWLSTRK